MPGQRRSVHLLPVIRLLLAKDGRHCLSTLEEHPEVDLVLMDIVLEGSYAKHLRGESKNPLHPIFGQMVDLLLERAQAVAEKH